MGKLASIFIGIFILGASQAVIQLNEFVPQSERLPFDYTMIVDYTSMGLYYLGIAIVGYAVVTAVLSIMLHNLRERRRVKKAEEAERRRRERLQEQYGEYGVPQGEPNQYNNQRREAPQQRREEY